MNQLERAGDDGLSAGDFAGIGAALEASIAPNTAKAYRAALDRFAAWLDGRPVTDTTVAAYVAALMDDGYVPATIKQAAAAAEGTTAGLRDAELLRTMSDALLRASEVAAIDTRDVSRESDGSGRSGRTLRRSRSGTGLPVRAGLELAVVVAAWDPVAAVGVSPGPATVLLAVHVRSFLHPPVRPPKRPVAVLLAVL